MGGDNNRSTAIIGNKLHLGGSEHDIDGVDDCSSFQRTVVTHHPFPAVAGIERDPITRLNTQGRQGVSKTIAQFLQIIKRQ